MSTLKTTRIETTSGDGVDVIGLSKIEDTGKNVCTAWANYNGNDGTIHDSYNISSITHSGTGDDIVYFAENMDSTAWALSGNAANVGDTTSGAILSDIDRAVGSTRVIIMNDSGNKVSLDNVCIIFFGGK